MSSYLVDGAWTLNPNLKNDLDSIIEDVKNVKTENLIDDRVVCTVGKSGDFVLRDTYNSLRHKETKNKWHKLVWFSSCVPRQCFIVWMCVQLKLKTRFKVLFWGMNVNPVFILCNTMLEDDFHMFFGCRYSIVM